VKPHSDLVTGHNASTNNTRERPDPLAAQKKVAEWMEQKKSPDVSPYLDGECAQGDQHPATAAGTTRSKRKVDIEIFEVAKPGRKSGQSNNHPNSISSESAGGRACGVDGICDGNKDYVMHEKTYLRKETLRKKDA